MNFIVEISSKCGQGIQEIRKFCGRHIWMPPNCCRSGEKCRCIFSQLQRRTGGGARDELAPFVLLSFRVATFLHRPFYYS